MFGPPGPTQLGEQLNRKLLSLAAIASLALVGCAASSEAAPETSTPATSVPAAASKQGDIVEPFVQKLGNCDESVGAAREDYSYVAMCGDDNLTAIVLELTDPLAGDATHQRVAKTFQEINLAGWWATGPGWMILTNENEARLLAELNGGDTFHVDGPTLITVDGDYIYGDTLTPLEPEARMQGMIATVEDAAEVKCAVEDFDFGRGELLSERCAKTTGDGYINLVVFEDAENVAQATQTLFPIAKLMDFDYMVMLGENWAIYNFDRSEGPRIQEILGVDYMDLKNWSQGKD